MISKRKLFSSAFLGSLLLSVFSAVSFAATTIGIMPSRYAMVVKGIPSGNSYNISSPAQWEKLQLWAIAYHPQKEVNQYKGYKYHWVIDGIFDSGPITINANTKDMSCEVPPLAFSGVVVDASKGFSFYVAKFYMTAPAGGTEPLYNRYTPASVPVFVFSYPIDDTDQNGNGLIHVLENIARGRGIHYLLKNQEADGRWDSFLYTEGLSGSKIKPGNTCPVGVTGIVMAALGSDPGSIFSSRTDSHFFSPTNYAEQYLMTKFQSLPASKMLVHSSDYYANYEQGAALLGLSHTFDSLYQGSFFPNLAKLMKNWMSGTQVKTGPVTGGWRYYNYPATAGQADLSASQWPILGLLAARERIRSSFPSELNNFNNTANGGTDNFDANLRKYVRAVQNESGAFAGGAFYGCYNPSSQKLVSSRSYGAEGKAKDGLTPLPNPKAINSSIDLYDLDHVGSILNCPADKVTGEQITSGTAGTGSQTSTQSLGGSVYLKPSIGSVYSPDTVTLTLPDPNASSSQNWATKTCTVAASGGSFFIQYVWGVNPVLTPNTPPDWKIDFVNANVQDPAHGVNISGASGRALGSSQACPFPASMGFQGACTVLETNNPMRNVTCSFYTDGTVYVSSQKEKDYIINNALQVSSYQHYDPGNPATPANYLYTWAPNAYIFGELSELTAGYNERWLLGTASLFTMMRYLEMPANDEYYMAALNRIDLLLNSFLPSCVTSSTVDRPGAGALDLYTMFCVTKALKASSRSAAYLLWPGDTTPREAQLQLNPNWRVKFATSIINNIKADGSWQDSWSRNEGSSGSVLGTAFAVLILREDAPPFPVLLTENKIPAIPWRLQASLK